MKKNSKIHVSLETNLLEKIKNEAFERGISISELCRQKLSFNVQLDRIELLIREVLKNERKN